MEGDLLNLQMEVLEQGEQPVMVMMETTIIITQRAMMVEESHKCIHKS
jgi:hypothetical protein